MDPLRVVLERSELGSEDLQGLQNLPVLQVLQVLLLQQQELHPLLRSTRTKVSLPADDYSEGLFSIQLKHCTLYLVILYDVVIKTQYRTCCSLH